jgi:hypothetical protein
MAKIKTVNGMKEHKVVSNKEWLTARKALLVKEKKFNRLRDELNRERRNLPWEKVDKEYVFDGPDGKRDAGRTVWQQQPAHSLSFHVRAGLEGGLPTLLVLV